jgi:UDP-N-acetylmuramoyl-L-alanyl-D-glutamate--2,6-diaminopimelate ligase
MKFAQVLNYFENKPHVNSELAEIDVKGLCYDSRKAEKGFIFFAIKGYKADGHDYIYKALDYGAAIVFIEKNRQGDFQDNNLSDKFVFVENTRQALAFCSKAFYSNPDEKMKIIGVTGTNGKTSITYMIKAAVNSANEKCGVIGTIAYFLGDKKIKAPNTTPESLEIYKMMHEMVRLNCKVCVMEVSSHALFLNRVDGIDFDAAIFTNLSEDHLDFHSNMEEYLNA